MTEQKIDPIKLASIKLASTLAEYRERVLFLGVPLDTELKWRKLFRHAKNRLWTFRYDPPSIYSVINHVQYWLCSFKLRVMRKLRGHSDWDYEFYVGGSIL